MKEWNKIINESEKKRYILELIDYISKNEYDKWTSDWKIEDRLNYLETCMRRVGQILKLYLKEDTYN